MQHALFICFYIYRVVGVSNVQLLKFSDNLWSSLESKYVAIAFGLPFMGSDKIERYHNSITTQLTLVSRMQTKLGLLFYHSPAFQLGLRLKRFVLYYFLAIVEEYAIIRFGSNKMQQWQAFISQSYFRVGPID